MRTRALSRLTLIGTRARYTDPAVEAILIPKARVSLQTTTVVARSIPGTVCVLLAWVDALIDVAHSVSQAIGVFLAHTGLNTESGGAVAELPTGARVVIVASSHADLILRAHSTHIAISVLEARFALAASSVLRTDAETRTVDVGVTRIGTLTARAVARPQTVVIGGAYLRFDTKIRFRITHLITGTIRVGTHRPTNAFDTIGVLGALRHVIALREASAVTVFSTDYVVWTVCVGAAGLLTSAKLAHSVATAVIVCVTDVRFATKATRDVTDLLTGASSELAWFATHAGLAGATGITILRDDARVGLGAMSVNTDAVTVAVIILDARLSTRTLFTHTLLVAGVIVVAHLRFNAS